MKRLYIAIALIWHDGKVLVARRPHDADHLPNVWEFPGGKCEGEETPRHCAQREVREEIGVEIEVIGDHPTITHEYSERHVTLYPFDCIITGGEPQSLQCSELRWLAPQELSEDEFPPANATLIQALKAKQRA